MIYFAPREKKVPHCCTIPRWWNKDAQFPSFCFIRAKDPIFCLATPLQAEEVDSRTREVMALPSEQGECLIDPGELAEEATAVQGGWFGRGYAKGKKKKKSSVTKETLLTHSHG